MTIQRIRANTRKRLLTVCVGALLFACLWFWSELTTWQRLVQSSNNRLLETAQVVSRHVDTIVALADQALAELTLQAQTASGDDTATRRLADDMQQLVRTSPVLGSISYLGADGRLISTTRERTRPGPDAALEEAIRFHRMNASGQIHIGAPPPRDRGVGHYLPISRRISGPAIHLPA